MHSEDGTEADPFAEAREKLFPPLRNRTLAQAAAALADNRVEIAESLVSRVLEKRPADHAALNLSADIARRAKRFDEAGRLIRRCIDLAPDCAGYRFNYSVILRQLDKFDEALTQLDRLLREDPGNPLYRDRKAAVLRLMGRHAEALVQRRELSEEYPEIPEVWLHYGHALRSVAGKDECIPAYRKVLQLAPSSIAAYSSLADLKTYRFTAVEIAGMETQLALPGTPADDRATLHFALGKAYGDEKEYEKSFENYAKGNALLRLGADFDPERLTRYRLNCQKLFTKPFLAERTGWGCRERGPIFIVGLPRSGSTLVEQILSSHSAIEGLEELPDLDTLVGQRLARADGERPPHRFWIGGWFEFRSALVDAVPHVLSHLDDGDFRSLGERYLDVTARRRKLGRPFFTDKGLRNFGYAGLIHLALPNAKIVDVRREPLDCGWSCFRSHFPGGQPFSCRLGDIGSHYANYVRLMAHFDRVMPGAIHRMIYERLVADPETEIRLLLDYLELPFEARCVRFHENTRAVNTLSSEQVRRPLYKSGVAQWRPYEPWLGPLKAALGPVLDAYPFAPD